MVTLEMWLVKKDYEYWLPSNKSRLGRVSVA